MSHDVQSLSPGAAPRRSVLDFPALRARLAGQHGKQFWRSLDELADTPEFQAYLAAEFPEQAPQLHDAVARRTFLKLMGASLALAGVSACTRQPTEKVFPYVKAPELIVPGKPLYFATAMPLGDAATGLLVESHMGRPTKVEGNPDHPASLGATDAFSQASVLELYDPDRSQVVRRVGEVQTWANFTAAVAELMAAQRASQGAGLRLLTGAVSSPSMAAGIEQLLEQYPHARWHRWEPVSRDLARQASRRVFGRPLDVQYHFDLADRVVALEADFLSCGPAHLRYAREYVRRRREPDRMNRLYVAETLPTNTGAIADHRVALRPDQLTEFALALAAAVGLRVREPAGMEPHAALIAAIARDLQQHRGRSIVIAGDQAPVAVQILAHALNGTLGNAGSTVVYTEPVEADPVEHGASLRELVAAMEAGEVELLVIAGTNPVYSAPADLEFAAKLARVPTCIHHGLYFDETAELCHWHVPAAHFLESWGDARAFDGAASIIQPLIAPLYEGRTGLEVIAALRGQGTARSYDLVREYWRPRLGGDFEAAWRRAVHDGVVPNSAAPVIPVTAAPPTAWADAVPPPAERPAGTVDIVFRPDPTIFDGRFANNAWLQELPKPLTKLTWDNVAHIAPATAERLGLGNGDLVTLELDGRSVDVPVWVSPGTAADVVGVQLGYGRSRAGQVGTGIGSDVYRIRTSAQPWYASGAVLRETGRVYPLATTQNHHSMEGRNLVRAGTLDEYRADPHFAASHETYHKSMFPPFKYEGYKWGMAIDLNRCVGCNACVVACVAENNIPVVGKDQVSRGREMHWLRVDTYYAGDLDAPEIYHQPVPCMHCELAPCEPVCPVNATVHDHEGLNAMVYNRCVGTRYCSNNCPYKVRRFNFGLFSDPRSDVLKMVNNPDVTVRSRGVMEKCTYCVQRISHGRIEAAREGRRIRDGEVVTACQQVCPAEAIVFGDLNDEESAVVALKDEPRNYVLLDELGTQPRTTYLARLSNPNPELAAAAPARPRRAHG